MTRWLVLYLLVTPVAVGLRPAHTKMWNALGTCLSMTTSVIKRHNSSYSLLTIFFFFFFFGGGWAGVGVGVAGREGWQMRLK